MKKIFLFAIAFASFSSFANDYCVGHVGVTRNYDATEDEIDKNCAEKVVVNDNNTTTLIEPYMNIGFKLSFKGSNNKNRICEAFELGAYVRGSVIKTRKASTVSHQGMLSMYKQHRVITEITCENI